MLLGVIADDFTGASDIANTIACGDGRSGGMITSQYMGIPSNPADPSVEAGVISLKTRSSPKDEAVAQSLQALRWLKAQGCEQIVFKYCSTFDSTAEGNIGPVAQALAAELGVGGVVVCPAFPRAGRTIYQGHLFVHDRLLNESGMQNHPLTPMTDADIRRWLSSQVEGPVGMVPLQTVRRGSEVLAQALVQGGQQLVVVDAVEDADLRLIGRACAGAPLVTGGSGVALGLPANFIRQGQVQGRSGNSFLGIEGPEAILAGSCSGATRGQIEQHAKRHPVLPISVDHVMAETIGVPQVLSFIMEHAGRAPLVYSSGTPEQVREAQGRYGREAVSATLDNLFATTAQAFLNNGGKRLVVAGGETSGAVAQALDLGEVMIGPEIDPGVPILISARRNAVLALKSGNFGQQDFFEKATRMLAGAPA
ncbi:3-oxo-tetronate kinase [Paracoccus sp. SY]|uniref:3-oxo-tetronate kinase n=1 Tax=Paracoccus sp. SY TaxID=1330255 RepID=UPI000CD15887|nr:3-oxo-tetronate kinase [Paracoccus sp. SY]